MKTKQNKNAILSGLYLKVFMLSWLPIGIIMKNLAIKLLYYIVLKLLDIIFSFREGKSHRITNLINKARHTQKDYTISFKLGIVSRIEKGETP